MGDRYKLTDMGPSGFGRVGAVVAANNSTDIADIPKGVVVTDVAGGSVLRFLPVGNADGEWITMTGVAVGYIPPWHIRRLHTDTTCTVYSVLDAPTG